MAAYKLSYFDIRAYGENARQILAYAGKDFEDHRQSRDDWEKVKPCESGTTNLTGFGVKDLTVRFKIC